MKFLADFHIHSKYSRATSREMDLKNISHWAKIKGIGLVGTGDFTHPFWFAELKSKLKEAGPGIYEYNGVNFILTSEISTIYTKNGRVRRVHTVVFAPSLAVVEKINRTLGRSFNITSDGRPILGLDTKRLVEILLGISPKCFIVPAHIWTPHFSVFGANSGFDDLEECFEEYTKHIHALETGLSSDPAMNWRLSKIDHLGLISCSDAHSPAKLGREACCFDAKLDYLEILRAVKNRDKKKFLFTIEFFPEEGKYHFDGHRNCKVSLSPAETKKNKGLCPACQRKVTVGVMHRVDDLSDRKEGFLPEDAIPYYNLVPLEEIISEALGKRVGTKSVRTEYEKIINRFGTEFSVLLDQDLEELSRYLEPRIFQGIKNVREGRVQTIPGYDGEYGKVLALGEAEPRPTKQMDLF